MRSFGSAAAELARGLLGGLRVDELSDSSISGQTQ